MKPTQERIDELMREHGITLITEDAYKFATLAYEAGRKDENEACAKVCEDLDDGDYAGGDQPYGIHYARAIRARGKQ